MLAGSTRLKAGTAQKLVLNMISTISMIRLGKTYGSLMVGVVATNDKLRSRVRRIVGTRPAPPDEQVDAALAEADGDAKVAIVALAAGVDAAAARARLDAAGGVVREALDREARCRSGPRRRPPRSGRRWSSTERSSPSASSRVAAASPHRASSTYR